MEKIIIIEDDKNLGSSLKSFFEDEEYRACWISRLSDFEKEHEDADLIVLDWRLPDGQGIDFLKKLRAMDINMPIVMLTARSELIDKIVGLESGANDYITKPFEPRELLARVRAQLRSSQSSISKQKAQVIKLDSLEIDLPSRTVSFAGKNINLTKLEFELLILLASDPNRVFSRYEILNKVWGYENFPTTRTIDTHILQLRQKISDEYFETIRGVGYRIKFAIT